MIPYNRPWLDASDRQAVAKVLQGSWLTTGPEVSAFEDDLKHYTGAGSALVVSSGTAALALAFTGLDVANSWVIVPSITFFSTASAVWRSGGNVWIADCNPKTGLMELEHLTDAFNRLKNKGITPKIAVFVHLGGRMSDLESMAKWCRDHGLAVVEDACHAFGGHYPNGEKVGKCVYADLVCLSFHAVKTITCGEGGAVLFQDSKQHRALHRQLAKLRHHGIELETQGQQRKEIHHDTNDQNIMYDIADVGWNDRLNDMSCALGRSQLKKIDQFVDDREKTALGYLRALVDLKSWSIVPSGYESRSSWHLMQIQIPAKRNDVLTYMKKSKIGVQCHYPPLHMLSASRSRYGLNSLPGSETFADQTLSIPLYVKMRDQDQQYVISTLHDAYASVGE